LAHQSLKRAGSARVAFPLLIDAAGAQEGVIWATWCAKFTLMTELLEEALRQVAGLSADDQDAAADALLDYVTHMRSVRLTDEQIAEVERRLHNSNRVLLSAAEALKRIERLGSRS